MELSVTFPNHPTAAKQSLQVHKKLGHGKFTVYQAYSSVHKANFALKVFPKDHYGTTQYQKEALLSTLNHTNIIQNIPINVEGESRFHVVLTEFAKYGDFFDIVVAGVFNTEVLIRTYFHQLIAALEHMHSKKVAHLDLKLENLMMGSGFNLKIIDFDQAQRLSDKKITSGGTKGFRAPEVINGSCSDLAAADIYSAGVALYSFRAQEYPFAETTVEKNTVLKYYSTFMKNNQAFWEMKATQKKDQAFFSASFKELVNGMLNCDVKERFTIADIKKSKWYNGPVLDEKSLRAEMRPRYERFLNQQ